ncbi:anti-sigma F factor [Bianquea renquensis]|uniref:Anti-sigma F factor n=1 Tax=Bianquea renquensis TaxID=2763661 RepID=A0A926DNL8_9FIRM|nr:anti-sigma F factor [Bianquea renquensis]MBC8542303.1 anti-sigma F factor [Bianquea renquensis]
MNRQNYMKVEFTSRSENEAFARVAVSAFITQLDPTLEELEDVKTAVSEAVTNAIIHGYENEDGVIYVACTLNGQTASITVEDHGKGIPDVKLAMEPLYTSKPELERSGMGFTMMQTFMDSLDVQTTFGKGTTVTMTKTFQSSPADL